MFHMNKNKTYLLISTVFFSVGILMLLLLSNNNILAYGQGQNQKNLDENNNLKYKYIAILTGNEQVPVVKTTGIGSASIELLDDNKTLHYQINVLDVPKNNRDSYS